ncbi:glycosyltransferase family 2 protein [Sediminimonas qiaohouensis]|uniref:glycosyltransferase family 2 protein n=1 Tax=Sediminimonas qiaohouensis TaxID=552061 RepID=UPI000400C3BF|nr:glycosyltransferase family 2 protein [Sediminimonas qiaohouensis]
MTKDIFTVISTMKNEGPFVLEWVSHYKSLGFDNILVCTNDCEDSTRELLRALERKGLVRHHPTRIWPRAGIHRSALKQALRYDEVKQADWNFVCDVDEFLNIKIGDGSVRALVEASGPGADVIAVPWRNFGPGDVRRFTDRPVTHQFRLAEHTPATRKEAGKFVKSLFCGLEKYRRVGIHAPIPHDDWEGRINTVSPGGVPTTVDGERVQPSFEVAQVNHYALRAMETFLVKRARGRANHMSHTLGMQYWKRFDLNDVPDNSIRRYDALVNGWLSSFMADPELRSLHEQSVEWYERRITELRADPELADLVREIDEFRGVQPRRPALRVVGAA